MRYLNVKEYDSEDNQTIQQTNEAVAVTDRCSRRWSVAETEVLIRQTTNLAGVALVALSALVALVALLALFARRHGVGGRRLLYWRRHDLESDLTAVSSGKPSLLPANVKC